MDIHVVKTLQTVDPVVPNKIPTRNWGAPVLSNTRHMRNLWKYKAVNCSWKKIHTSLLYNTRNMHKLGVFQWLIQWLQYQPVLKNTSAIMALFLFHTSVDGVLDQKNPDLNVFLKHFFCDWLMRVWTVFMSYDWSMVKKFNCFSNLGSVTYFAHAIYRPEDIIFFFGGGMQKVAKRSWHFMWS